MISVSIIIPAWNEGKVLNATLKALLNIEYDKNRCEIIVVAGGDDNTYEIAQNLSSTNEIFARYVVFLQGPHGKNAAIQQGILGGKHEIIVLLDADTRVSGGFLKSLLRPIEQGLCDLAIANPEPLKRNWISDYYMITKQYYLNKITSYSGNAMAFRANTVVKRLEYFFDRQVMVGVDYLLIKRFLEDGKTCVFVKDATITTHLPSSIKYFVRCELRWLTAFIDIDGVNYRALISNVLVVLSLILAIPLSKIPFILSLLFNIAYVTKRSRMFLIASRQYNTGIKNLFGFIILSYAYHIIGFIAYIKHFLGLSKTNYLCQGQRY